LATPIQPGGDVEVAIRGLEDIRSAALLLIISSILGMVGLAIGLGLILAAIGGALLPGAAGIGRLVQALSALLGAVTVFMILLIVGLILGLVAIFAKLIPGLGKLKQWRAEFSTAHTLVKIGMAWGLILLLLAIVLGLGIIIASVAAQSLGGVLIGAGLAFILVIIGLILLLIGCIGIILACFNLNSVFRESMYLVAGVLFIVSLIISLAGILVPGSWVVPEILSLISWILIYVAVPRSIASLRSIQPTPAQPAQMV